MKAWDAARRRSESCRIVEHIVFLDHDFYQTECGEIVRPDDETCPRCSRGFGPDFVRNIVDCPNGPQWNEIVDRLNDAEDFVCSACMYSLVAHSGEAWTTGPFRYCPGCGDPIDRS